MIHNQKRKGTPIYTYGYSIIEFQNFGKASKTSNTMHLIIPSTIAKITSLINKFQAVFGNILLFKKSQASSTINPMFQFALTCQIQYDMISYDFRPTGYQIDFVKELQEDINQSDSVKLNQVKKLVNKLVSEISLKYQHFQRKQKSRVQKLISYKKVVDAQAQRYIRKYFQTLKDAKISSVNEDQQFVHSQQFIKSQFQVIKLMDLLHTFEQQNKWIQFVHIYKEYFSTQMIEYKKFRPYLYQIKIDRPSAQSQPILMKLQHFISLREYGQNYRLESQQLIKDLLNQCKIFHIETSKYKDNKITHKFFYQFLNPQSIIIDQITLRPKLSYEPLIRDLLGIKNKPCSPQCRLIFFRLPKLFDYFQSYQELILQNQLKLNDPKYGKEYLYRKLNNKGDKELIEKQRLQLQALKETIFVERFLLVSYYILNNKQYGRREINQQEHISKSYKQIQSDFKNKLIQMKKASQDSSKLKTFLGDYQKSNAIQFNFKFNDLFEYLPFEEKDSFIENMKFKKIQQLFNLKYSFVRQIIGFLENKIYFQKIANFKKYTIIFLVISIQNLDELKANLNIDKQKYVDIPEMKSYLQKNGVKLKEGKRAEASIQTTWKRIEQYKVVIPSQSHKFLCQDPYGKKLYAYLGELKSEMAKQKQTQNSILKYIDKNASHINYRHQLRDMARKSIAELSKLLKKYRRILYQFVHQEMNFRYQDGPHYSNFSQQNFFQFSKLTTKYFLLIVYSFITIDAQNFMIYDSLIKNNLLIGQQRKKITIPEIISKSYLQDQKNQLIQFTKNNLTKYQYLYQNAPQLIGKNNLKF